MAETKNVYQRLLEAQGHIIAQRQESRFRSGSRSAEQIQEAAKPHLRAAGLLLHCDEEVEYIGDRHRIKVTATVFNVDKPEEYISSSASAWEGEVTAGLDTSQVSGKTGSYAKKYALQDLLAIDDTKDADFDSDEDVKARTEAEEHRKRVMDVMSLKDKPNAELENIKTEIDHMLEDAGHNAVKRKAALSKLTTVEEAQRALDAMKGGNS